MRRDFDERGGRESQTHASLPHRYHARTALKLWLAVGAVVFAFDADALFISWQALVFFLPGMFLAAIGFGGLSYALNELASDACASFGAPIAISRAASVGLIAIEIAAVYVVARLFVTAMW